MFQHELQATPVAQRRPAQREVERHPQRSSAPPIVLAQRALSGGFRPAGAVALQRAYGNQAVQRMLAQRHAVPTVGPARPPLIQRKVGFEFEVPEWRVNTARPLAKNTRLMNGNGWYLQNDVLGGGVSDPEFVTRPVDETDDGWRQLDTAMQDMNVTLAALDGAITNNGTETVANLGGSHPTATITGTPPFIGDPQVSAGVNLARLTTLLTDLSHDPAGHAPQSVQSQQLAVGGLAGINLAECIQQAAQVCAPGGPRVRSEAYEGLITLVGSFVRSAASIGAEYMKQAAHVMSRSNLPQVVAQLPEANWRGHLDANTFLADVLAVADLGTTDFGEGPELFPYLLNTFSAQERRREPWRFLNRNRWIRGLANGTDSLRGLQGSSSWGELGLERVGPEETGWFGRDVRPEGIIVELRDVRQNVPWDHWYPFAIAVFHYMREMNDLAVAAPQYQGFAGFGTQGVAPPVPGAPPVAPPTWWERRLQNLQDIGAFLRDGVAYTLLGG